MKSINKETLLKEFVINIADRNLDKIFFELSNMEVKDEILLAKQGSLLIREWLGADYIELIREKLLNQHYACLIQGINFCKHGPIIAKRFLIAFSGVLGSPTYTDEIDKLVAWDVTPRKELYVRNTTFSQRDGEAELHTDTQYYPYPEKYFILGCYKKASDGGNNILLEGRNLLEEIYLNNQDLFHSLKTIKVPFRVPSSFTRSGTDDSVELYFSTILSDDIRIRYRKETIEKGLVFLSESEQIRIQKLINEFESYLGKNRGILEFGLEDNDILICNNHEYLHGRTHFSDPERLLFRIRFN